MRKADNHDNTRLPSGAGVMIAASIGALFWVGALVLL